ncbi:hypothetical protein [Elizabethkingia phage TCUEAP1]|nr:hypothetical protein [Elizabethkingia phage TCUEAP1]
MAKLKNLSVGQKVKLKKVIETDQDIKAIENIRNATEVTVRSLDPTCREGFTVCVNTGPALSDSEWIEHQNLKIIK